VIFLAIFGCKRVDCDEMEGDRPRFPANRNCHRLSHVSCHTVASRTCDLGSVTCYRPDISTIVECLSHFLLLVRKDKHSLYYIQKIASNFVTIT